MGLTQASLKFLLLLWVLKHVIFVCVCVCVCVCVPFKSGVSVSYIFLTFLKVSLAGIQSQTL